jgi:hypothetical protein
LPKCSAHVVASIFNFSFFYVIDHRASLPSATLLPYPGTQVDAVISHWSSRLAATFYP